MIPPHNIYQIYHFLSVRDDCTPPKCGELSEYTDSAHTEVVEEIRTGRWRTVEDVERYNLDKKDNMKHKGALG